MVSIPVHDVHANDAANAVVAGIDRVGCSMEDAGRVRREGRVPRVVRTAADTMGGLAGRAIQYPRLAGEGHRLRKIVTMRDTMSFQ